MRFKSIAGLFLIFVFIGLPGCANLFSSPLGESPSDIMNQDIDLDLGVMKAKIREEIKDVGEDQGIPLDDEAVEMLARVVENRMGGINQYNTIIVTLDPTVANGIINATMQGLADVVNLGGSWMKESAATTNDPRTEPVVLPGKVEVIEREKRIYVPVEPDPVETPEEPLEEPVEDPEPGTLPDPVEDPEDPVEDPVTEPDPNG